MTITDEQVADFLKNDLEFFYRNPELTRSLALPTGNNQTISLIDFQIRKLREQVIILKRENDHMIETARINSMTFEKTKNLILNLLDAHDLDDLAIALDEKLSLSFNIPYVLLLLSSQFKIETDNPIIRRIDQNALSNGGDLVDAISDHKPWMGRLTKKRRSLLFPNTTFDVQSCATLPLIRGHTFGILVIGHPDPTHFQSNQDTLFLDHIGETLSLLLPRLLQEAIC